jgi:ferredoxin/flavodoxin---NADP+ reductase
MNLPAAGLPPASANRAFNVETVLSVHHWTEDYFSFRTTRSPEFRFENGQFVMIGLEVDGRPLLRAYSIASANWEEELEFFSIKVPQGPLTSRLQHLRVGDKVLVGRKPTGTLLLHDLHPGRVLYLLGTGTGLAPWLSIVKDPATYEQFETVVVAHGVRRVADLAYRDAFEGGLQAHEWLGPTLQRQLRYYPATTREAFRHQGRLTDLLASGQMATDLGLPPLDPQRDRAMICGGPAVLEDFRRLLDARGFTAAPRIGVPGDYVFERAFVEK